MTKVKSSHFSIKPKNLCMYLITLICCVTIVNQCCILMALTSRGVDIKGEVQFFAH